MAKIRFGMIGSGWRAEFYLRIAAALPEQFEVTSVFIRDADKAERFGKQFGVKTTTSLEELYNENPNYVVLTTKHGTVFGYLNQLIPRGIPVLCETPPGETIEELNQLWELCRKYPAKVQFAEQYFVQPLYAAWYQAVLQGLLGEVENITVSALHGYHGASIIRRFLGTNMQNCKLYGKQYEFHVTETFGRTGMRFDGEIVPKTREKITFEFENGKIAFFDFSNVQYHSFIRTRHFNVQGTRGEIDDLVIRYLTKENIPVMQSLNRIDLGIYNNQEWSHHGIMLGDKFLYQTPFPNARLNDDEIAVATCMKFMQEYLETGREFYSLEEELQDAYLSFKMKEALANPNCEIFTQTQSWAKK